MYGIIYTVTNRANGKQYVGQTTTTVEKRWAAHVSDAVRGSKNGCSAIQNAVRKYGPDAFDVEAIVACDDQEELDRMEVMAIKAGGTLRPGGYNLMTGGSNGLHSAESRAMISAAKKGKTHSPETRAKISEAMAGHSVSLETRAKMSAAHGGKPKSQEHRVKIGEAVKAWWASRKGTIEPEVSDKGG